ncbi:sulfatase-like hydrolase/transferase [Silvibacterium sp.]|uniref:sulfatase-like hydrolase/transferase n=1 Tax=Silvibacterium sp. TaxID=1964179 RepID=UPI0039E5FA78
MKTRLWLEGAGTGIVFSIGLCWNQISPTHLYLYHRLLPVTTMVRATTIDLVLACLLGTAIVWLLDKIDSQGRTLLWLAFAGVIVARLVAGLMASEVILKAGITPVKFWLPVCAAGLLLWLLARKAYSFAVNGLRTLLLLLGICIFWMLPELVALSLQHTRAEAETFSRNVPHVPSPHRRVIWALFDELSWNLTFDQRWPGLDLPNFDQLRAQSVSFPNLQPAGFYTEQVVPSLLLGKPIEEVRSTPQGWLQYRPTAHGSWQSFQGEQTLFADAHRQGWTTGLAGIYNPYCRLLPSQLDVCWSQLLPFADHMSPDQSTFSNVMAPIHASWVRSVQHPEQKSETHDGVTAILREANTLIANEDVDFVFLHLPLPHPPGEFDRRTGRIRSGGSYLDNLALADQVLGSLRQEIARTGSAGQTTLVVSSDHSWRIPLWRFERFWTEEDETLARSQNYVFDPRPVLMVSFPGESAGLGVKSSLPLLDMHEMLEEILSGRIASSDQLQAWALHAQKTP